ncbi:MAG: DUF1566 domain-containing protein, partial [Sulfurimonas sp.]|nr:DUF1566 domain-containing protein [Sulfurimonas sp.]
MKKTAFIFMACVVLSSGVSGEVYEVSKSFYTLIRDDAKEVVIDPKTQLMWQDDASVKSVKKNWQGARDYCSALRFAGYDDWRLPKRLELSSITDKSKEKPAIKAKFANVVSDRYWSSSSYVSNAGYAWRVYFYNGYDRAGNKSDEYYVRCVRDSDTLSIDSFATLYEGVLEQTMASLP